jgi:hypothetical protein
VSIYSELLRVTLDGDGPEEDQTLVELVSEALSCRAYFAPTDAHGRGAADRIGDALAYDAALVRLCQRLSVQHDFWSDSPPGDVRQEAEQRLAARLPSIAAALAPLSTGSEAFDP